MRNLEKIVITCAYIGQVDCTTKAEPKATEKRLQSSLLLLHLLTYEVDHASACKKISPEISVLSSR